MLWMDRQTMPKRLAILLLLGLAMAVCALDAQAQFNIIPQPQKITAGTGSFTLDRHATIAAPTDKRARQIADFLRGAVRAQTGIDLSASKEGGQHARIELRIDPAIRGDEAYHLDVTSSRITISASSDRGLFWGVQTLRQLLPLQHAATLKIPAVRIEDAPTYAYRGVMLDVGRPFYTVSFIEKQLDVLSYYKINTFHWHLTDDQGWRIQIKRYPKLTSVGAWRTEADGSRYGGFYTQAQIRQVVAYASARNITVIPEIEMPGHSTAAIAAYPQLSCDKKQVTVPATWGVFKDIDCVGDPGTFTFLENVLDEVMPLFPSSWVHIGGDEVPKDDWKDCASCMALMHAKGMKNAEELQSYFIKHIQRYLVGKGKTMIGWDEILEGGANKNAIIEIWRGDSETAKALLNGNRVIIAGPFYLDSPMDKLTTKGVYQTDITGSAATLYSKAEQGTGEVIAAHRSQILGAEAPLWSERANPLNAEAKLYPRVLALAENLWSGDTHSDAAWANFQQRLQAQYHWLDAQRITYGPQDKPVVTYSITADAQGDGWHLHAQRGFDDVHNHYTLDGSMPTTKSPAFDDSVAIRKPGTLRVTPFRYGMAYDEATSFTLEDNLARGRTVSLAQAVSSSYAPATVLVDGVVGSTNFHDCRWAAWEDHDVDATIDLGRSVGIHSLSADFLQDVGSRILPPQRVTFSVSSDGQHWTPLYVDTPKTDLSDDGQHRWLIRYQPAKAVTARYLRVVANRHTDLPADFPGGNKNTWLFVDEIRVR
jgi:hexosaminidase